MSPHANELVVGIGQIPTVVGDLDATAEKHLSVIDKARTRDVDLLLFPELSLTGHGGGVDALDLALPRDGRWVNELARASGPMCTVFGFIEEAVAASFYNVAVAVKDGSVIHVHRKIVLATYGQLDEGKYYSQGRFIETFELGGPWRVGILICNDLWHPALVHLMAVHGATLMLAPVSSGLEAVSGEFDNPSGWQTCMRFHTMVFGCPALFANRVGIESGLTFWGGSAAYGPRGETIARLGDEEDLLITRLDFGAVRRARYDLPIVRDSNLDLIRREVIRMSDRVGVPDVIRKMD